MHLLSLSFEEPSPLHQGLLRARFATETEHHAHHPTLMGIDAQATTQALANLFSLQSERLQQLAFHIPIQPHELVEQTMTIVRRPLLL